MGINKYFAIKNQIMFISALLILSFSNSSCQQNRNNTYQLPFNDYNNLMLQLVKDNDINGAAVVLFDYNKIIWSDVYGYLNDGDGKKVNPETIFSIQSMSKTITTTAVMVAVQKGLIDLDKPITEYIPEFKVNSCFENDPQDKITMRNLLSCTAGFTHEAPIGNNYNPSFLTYDEHCKSISDTWLKFPVGTNYSYSNLGFDLAAYIIERVSKESFQDYLDKELFKPLDMQFTTISPNKIMNNQNRAIGSSSGIKSMPAIMPFLGAGAVYTNITNMAKFVQFHLNLGKYNDQQILRKEYFLEIYKPIIVNYFDYALGIAIVKEGDSYSYNHNGGGFGFGSTMKWYPEYNLGVIILTNSDFSGAVYNTASNIADDYIKKNKLNRDSSKIGYNPVAYYDELKKQNATEGSTKTIECKGDSLYKPEWEKYEGTYTLAFKGGWEFSWTANIARFFGFKKQKIEVFERNNYLFLKYYDGNSYQDDQKLREYKLGLFFTNDGEALDFRKNISTYRNIYLE